MISLICKKLEEVKTRQQQSVSKKVPLPPFIISITCCMNSSIFDKKKWKLSGSE